MLEIIRINRLNLKEEEKMKKRHLRLAIVLILTLTVLGLAACGGDSGNDSADSDPGAATTEEPASDDTSATDGETAEAVAEETLKVGFLLHTTEWFAAVDKPNYDELNALVAYVNEDLGGWEIGGKKYKIEAVNVDGQSDPDAVRTAAMSLVDAGVKFVVETNDFWVTGCTDVFEEAGILHACAYVTYSADYMGPNNPLAFTASDGSVGDYAAAFEVLKKNYPDVKSVIFANDDNGVNEKLFQLMSDYGKQYGIEVLPDYIKYAGDTTDYSSVATQVVKSGADCFMGNGSPTAFGAILKDVRAQGSDVVCACVQGKPATMLMEYAGADASSNAFTLGASTRESDLGENPEILNNLVEKVRQTAGDESASNFDGAGANNLWVLLQVMQKCGSVDPEEVAKAWTEMDAVDTIYGVGTPGGEETYGIANHAIGHPKPVSLIDPSQSDGWAFDGWIDVKIP
jgi:branched-chain amino acid transport system substrate-binding protein